MDKSKSMDEEIESALLKMATSKTRKKEVECFQEDQPVSILALFSFSSTFERFLILIGILVSFFMGLLYSVSFLIQYRIIGSFIKFTVKNDPLIRLEIYEYLMLNFASGLAIMFLGYLSAITLNTAAKRQTQRIRLKFFESILYQDMAWFDLHGSKDFATKVTSDLQKIQDGIGEKIGLCVYYISTCIFTVAIGFYLGWKVSLTLLAIVPFFVYGKNYAGILQAKMSMNEAKINGEAVSLAEEVLRAIRTVFAFGGESKEVERFTKSLQSVKISGIRRSCFDGLSNGFFWLSAFISFGFGLWYGSKLVLSEEYSASDALSTFGVVLKGIWYVSYASPLLETIAIARGAATGIFNTIGHRQKIIRGATIGKRPEKVIGRIKFESIYFSYPARPDVTILQGLEMTIDSGQTVAIVGASGCGKSTILQLIQRLYDPLSGKVYLDGVNIKALNLAWLRDQIGTVGQEPVLFAMSIKENIRLGHLAATDEDIILAAKAANAHQFISKLPLGYETVLGEKGAQISGGQKQRIAIARALVKKPKILLLDEATSALDMESEAVVQAALEKASVGRTTLIVAHRLSTIQNADKIIVVDKGVVTEMGTHEELLDKKGLYYKLISEQQSAPGSESPMIFEGNVQDNSDVKPMTPFVSKVETGVEDFNTSEQTIFGHSNYEMSLFKMVFENKICLSLGLVAAALNALSIPCFAFLMGNAIGLWSSADHIKQESDFYGVLFLILGIACGVVNILQSYMFGIIGHNIAMKLRRSLFEAYLRQEPAWFDKPCNAVGILCTRLSSDTEAALNALSIPISVGTQLITLVIAVFSLCFYYNWKLAIVACLMLPISLAAGFAKAKILKAFIETNRKSTEISTNIALEVISNIKTVISLGLENHFYAIFKEATHDSFHLTNYTDHLEALIVGHFLAFSTLSYTTLWLFGAYLILNNEIDYADVVKISEAVSIASKQFLMVLTYASNFQSGKASIRNIIQVMNRKTKIDTESGKELKDIQGNIEFDSVFFSYPQRPNLRVLNGLNMVLEPGRTTAMVGASGCGKSTIIQLLLRFYDVDSGRLVIDDNSIKDLNVSWLRSRIGLVQQEPTLFNYSIQDNIAYGDNRRQVTFDEIVVAAQHANIHNFIKELPDGYLTNVGDCGSQLSGGQKQRIAIARALIRKPEILLLDEATSALDTESEKIVQETLNEVMKGRTCVVIAHRLSTVQNADKIMVLKDGQIVEQGTHNELIQLKGAYFQLLNQQNSGSI